MDAEQGSIIRRQDMRHFLFTKDAAHDPQLCGKLVTLTQDLDAHIFMKIVFLHQVILEARSIVVVRVDDKKLVGDTF